MAVELTCKLCGNSDVEFLFSEQRNGIAYKSYHCRACNLYQTLGDIESVSPDYVDLEENDLDAAHVYLQRVAKQSGFRQWLETVRKLTSHNTGRPPKVLDIGCGVGGFLDFAKANGFETYGFDASKAQVAQAKANHPNVGYAISIDDYMAQFDTAPQFDFVTMWDVFEHIRDPKTLLTEVRKHLPSHAIYFVSVPSGAPTKAKLALAKLRGRDPGLIPWEHVFYYTPDSLARVFEDNGYAPLKVTGVVPYVHEMSGHELIRRAVQAVLRPTPYAFQICAFAKPDVS